MKRKIIALSLALALAASSFVGCSTSTKSEGSKEESKDTSSATESKEDSSEAEESTGHQTGADFLAALSEPVAITMLYRDNASYPYNADWKVFEYLKEKNVDLQLTVVASADFDVKKEVVYNSGNIPDLVGQTYATSSDVASGILLPISEYEEYMPTFTAFMDEIGARDDLDATRFADGKYYSFPTNTTSKNYQIKQWCVRTDVFEENNIKIPTTMDEIYDAGVKLLEIYPDSTPISNRFGANSILNAFGAAFGVDAGGSLGNGVSYNHETKEWYYSPTTDGYKEMLTYVKKLYDAGILDAEFSTMDSTSYEQKAIQGEMFMLYDWVNNLSKYNFQGKEQDDNYNMSPIYPPQGPNGDYSIIPMQYWSNAYSLPATLADDEDHLREVLAFLDWSYTDESETLLSFGKEGETYFVDENGHNVVVDAEVDSASKFGFPSNCMTPRKHLDVVLYAYVPLSDIEVFDQVVEDGITPAAKPQTPLTVDQLEQTQVLEATLKDYVTSMTEGFIFGSESLDNWDAFVAECEAKGSVDLTNMYNGK